MRLVAIFAATLCLFASAESRLIKGQVVPVGTRPDIVFINSGLGNGKTAGCTATVVGKRAVITASHCGGHNQKSQFTTNGKTYTGTFLRSSLYPARDHDIAMVVTSSDIEVKPSSVGGIPLVGTTLTIFGYGCILPGGKDQIDGNLRTGTATVTGFTKYDIVSSGGAALCFGDSGGPDFMQVDGKPRIVSVNSKGDIATTNYTTRVDLKESKDFFAAVIAKYKVEICGINTECDGPALEKFYLENDLVKVEVTNKGKIPTTELKAEFKEFLDQLEE